jgi:hypothetical protein
MAMQDATPIISIVLSRISVDAEVSANAEKFAELILEGP